MKLLKRHLSLFLMLLLLIETAGFNHLRHCCGYDQIVSVFNEDGATSCVDSHTHHHDHDDMSAPVAHAHVADCACSCGHDASLQNHHHSGNCLHADYILLKTETGKKSIFSLAQIAVPAIIQLFNFEPLVEQRPYFHQHPHAAKIELGRTKLALFATLLI